MLLAIITDPTRTTEGRQNGTLKPANTCAGPTTCGLVTRSDRHGSRASLSRWPTARYPPVRLTPDKSTKRCRQARPTEHLRWANNLRINLIETPLTCKSTPLVYNTVPLQSVSPQTKAPSAVAERDLPNTCAEPITCRSLICSDRHRSLASLSSPGSRHHSLAHSPLAPRLPRFSSLAIVQSCNYRS